MTGFLFYISAVTPCKSLVVLILIFLFMSNALLAMSGPAFGNIDITTYNVYSVFIQSSGNSGTVFSGVTWNWCMIDISNTHSRIIRPIGLSRSSIISADMYIEYAAYNNSTGNAYVVAYWTATATSLSVKSYGSDYTCVAYVPSN